MLLISTSKVREFNSEIAKLYQMCKYHVRLGSTGGAEILKKYQTVHGSQSSKNTFRAWITIFQEKTNHVTNLSKTSSVKVFIDVKFCFLVVFLEKLVSWQTFKMKFILTNTFVNRLYVFIQNNASSIMYNFWNKIILANVIYVMHTVYTIYVISTEEFVLQLFDMLRPDYYFIFDQFPRTGSRQKVCGMCWKMITINMLFAFHILILLFQYKICMCIFRFALKPTQSHLRQNMSMLLSWFVVCLLFFLFI